MNGNLNGMVPAAEGRNDAGTGLGEPLLEIRGLRVEYG